MHGLPDVQSREYPLCSVANLSFQNERLKLDGIRYHQHPCLKKQLISDLP
jgi:hypothetical protein